LVAIAIICTGCLLNTEVVVALEPRITVAVGDAAWLAGIVGQITPHAGGVRVILCITHPIKLFTHVVAQAESWYWFTVAAGRLTNIPLRTDPIDCALV
jgi:hypothetical protein